jgi:hypothetical protein
VKFFSVAIFPKTKGVSIFKKVLFFKHKNTTKNVITQIVVTKSVATQSVFTFFVTSQSNVAT